MFFKHGVFVSLLLGSSFLVIVNDDAEKLAQLVTVEVFGLEIERDLDLGGYFLVSFLDFCEEWVRQGFIDSDAEVWVELKHPVDQVDSLRRRAWIFFLEVNAIDWHKTFKVTVCLLVGDEGHVVVGWSSKHLENNSELVIFGDWETVSLDSSVSIWAKREARLSWEQRSAVHVRWSTLLHHAKKFAENATDGPHIDGWTVVFLEQNQLRSAIPPGHDVASQLALHVFTHLLCLFELSHQFLTLLLFNLCRLVLILKLVGDRHAAWGHITRFNCCVLNASHLDILSSVVFLFLLRGFFKSLSNKHCL